MLQRLGAELEECESTAIVTSMAAGKFYNTTVLLS